MPKRKNLSEAVTPEEGMVWVYRGFKGQNKPFSSDAEVEEDRSERSKRRKQG